MQRRVIIIAVLIVFIELTKKFGIGTITTLKFPVLVFIKKTFLNILRERGLNNLLG